MSSLILKNLRCTGRCRYLLLSNDFKRSYTTKKWLLKFPDIMDTKEAVIEKWLKKEGDSFSARESLCEVSLIPSDLIVGVDSDKPGCIAKVLIPTKKKSFVNDPIAILVASKEELLVFMDEMRVASRDEEVLKETAKVMEAAATKRKPDTKSLLRQIRSLIQDGQIEEGSDFAKKLLSCARKGNKELLAIFEASYDEGALNFDTDSFDAKFFLENAKDIIDDLPVDSSTTESNSNSDTSNKQQ